MSHTREEIAAQLRLAELTDDELVAVLPDVDLDTDDLPVLAVAADLLAAERTRRGITRFVDLAPGDVVTFDLGAGPHRFQVLGLDVAGLSTVSEATGLCALIPFRAPRTGHRWGALRVIR